MPSISGLHFRAHMLFGRSSSISAISSLQESLLHSNSRGTGYLLRCFTSLDRASHRKSSWSVELNLLLSGSNSTQMDAVRVIWAMQVLGGHQRPFRISTSCFPGIHTRASNTEAELTGILHCLYICRDLAFSQVWIEVDATAAITLLQTTAGGHWQVRNIIRKIRDLLQTMVTRITHIYREGNSVADTLANMGCRSRSFRSWESHNIPPQIRGAVCYDRISLPYLRLR